MNRKIIRIILVFLLSAMLVFSTGMMIYDQIQYQITVADADEAAQLVGFQPPTADSHRTEPEPSQAAPAGTKAPAEPAGTKAPAGPAGTKAPAEPVGEGPAEPAPPEEELTQEEATVRALAGMDLGALRAVNKDVVGWIYIPGTVVSYPLMQGKDNQAYLRRNWKKESISSGSIFIEAKCSKNLTDFHTIVYGHRMRNETMFGTIKYYSGVDYWREHPSVYIVLDDAIYRYDIFSAHEAALDSLVYRLDLEESHLEEEFLQFCKDSSVLDTGLAPEAEERILTLSTCTGDGYSKRWVVHGVLAYTYSRNDI